MIRQPAVAGQFYSGSPDELRNDLTRLIHFSTHQDTVAGVIAPHAGYIYSGSCAGLLYGSITIPRTVIILGPNHHGIGAATAMYPDGEWLTPLGSVSIATELSELIRRHCPMVRQDYRAHLHEHSLEVQVPFLQYLRPDLEIVPICLGFGEYQSCLELGEGIAASILEYEGQVLIVASSDMTHYESAPAAKLKDEMVLEYALSLDPEGMLNVCRASNITMCGVVPATVMLIAAKFLGATRAKLVNYTNSGEVNGDFRRVVGYAGLTVA